ncbi:hypothetical protein VS883_27650, partial [Escherichia coli]
TTGAINGADPATFSLSSSTPCSKNTGAQQHCGTPRIVVDPNSIAKTANNSWCLTANGRSDLKSNSE